MEMLWPLRPGPILSAQQHLLDSRGSSVRRLFARIRDFGLFKTLRLAGRALVRATHLRVGRAARVLRLRPAGLGRGQAVEALGVELRERVLELAAVGEPVVAVLLRDRVEMPHVRGRGLVTAGEGGATQCVAGV